LEQYRPGQGLTGSTQGEAWTKDATSQGCRCGAKVRAEVTLTLP
jgi:hypothetical protein